MLLLSVLACGDPLYHRSGLVGAQADAGADGLSSLAGSAGGGGGNVGPGGDVGGGGRPMGGAPASGGSAPPGGAGAPSNGGFAATAGASGGPGGAIGTGGSLVPGPLLHLAFNETMGTSARDDAGNGKNGILFGANFVPGRFGNSVSFWGGSEYVALPAGLTASLQEMTVTFWVNLGAKVPFARAIEFGNSATTGYWYVSPTFGGGGILRFGISPGDWPMEQFLEAPALPLNQWKHVAVVVAAKTVTIYVDSVAVATSPGITLRPKDVGATPNNWLGRSQANNVGYLNGRLDELYIFGRALSATEIAMLMNGL